MVFITNTQIVLTVLTVGILLWSFACQWINVRGQYPNVRFVALAFMAYTLFLTLVKLGMYGISLLS